MYIAASMGTKSGRWNLRVTAARDAVVRRVLDVTGESLNDYVVRHTMQAAEADLADIQRGGTHAQAHDQTRGPQSA